MLHDLHVSRSACCDTNNYSLLKGIVYGTLAAQTAVCTFKFQLAHNILVVVV